jgi:ABC-type glycerol-3-phosphate transport system substrate-binding protein
MKKIISSFIALLLLLVLVGCIQPTSNESPNGEIFDETKTWEMYGEGHLVSRPIEIDYWHANSALDIQGKTMARMVEEFNAYQQETYPDSPITVKLTFTNGYIPMNQKLQAGLLGNTNPEIAMVGVSSMALYHSSAIDMREIFTYDEIRDIFPGFLQFAMYRDKFVAYPYFAASNVMVLNRTLLNRTGMHIPTVDEIVADPENSIWTWDYLREVIEAVRALPDAKEKNLYGLATNGIPLYESFFSYGEAPYDPSATKTAFKRDTAIKIFKYWQDMAKDDLFENPVIDPQHHNQIKGKYINGQYGIMIASSSMVLDMHNSLKDPETGEFSFEADVLPHPKQKYFYSNHSGGGLILFNNKNQTRRSAAVEFLRWLQAPEQQVEFSTNAGYLITTYSSRATQAWKDFTQNVNPTMDEVLKMMEFVPQAGLRLPIGRAKGLADDDFGKYSKGIFYENFKRTPADVVDECMRRVNQVLDENKE